jgi:hypothetical protein
MHKVAIAEWILSCAMSRERASAAAGDLSEVSGDLSFWTSMVRLAASASFRTFAKSPFKFLGAALLLWFAFLLVSILYALGAWLLWALFYLADNHTGLELLTERLGYRIPLAPPAGLAYFVGLVVLPAMAAWKMGADLSRKSPGSELASWFAIVAAWPVLGLLTKLPPSTPPSTICLPLLCLLGGMLRARWLDRQVTNMQ